MTKATEDDFLKILKEGVQSVLKNPEASASEKVKAIEAGAEILKAEHKIGGKGADGGDGNFFKRRKGAAT
jgi:hypothetical protein